MDDETLDRITAEVPEDISLPKARPADTAPVRKPGVKLVTQEYFDERMVALSDLMKTSMEPAIALMPITKRKEINAAFEKFESLVSTTAAKE